MNAIIEKFPKFMQGGQRKTTFEDDDVKTVAADTLDMEHLSRLVETQRARVDGLREALVNAEDELSERKKDWSRAAKVRGLL